MTIGRDVRQPDLIMRPAPVLGGLEPQLLADNRRDLEAAAGRRSSVYVPEWVGQGHGDDAGVAVVRVHSTLAETVNRRLNRLPRRLALDYLHAAGVRPLAATPAEAVGAVVVADGATEPVEVPEGSVFATPSGEVLESRHGCSAIPGQVAAAAVLADGWLVLDPAKPPYGLQPFGPRPRPSAQLWLGLATGVTPRGTLCLAVQLLPPPGRATAESAVNEDVFAPPLLRWEAVTAAGAVELAVDFDGTRGLQQPGVIGFRVSEPLWTPQLRPGQTTGTPHRWLRARLVTATFSPDIRIAEISLNGVTASAARSVRGEVAEPLDRSAAGSTYRLSAVPVVPGSVDLEITGSTGGLGVTAPTGAWSEVDSLASAHPDSQVFVLDAGTGVLSFGDGFHGRAVPEGYRNVLAREYRTGGGTAGLPTAGAVLPPEVSVSDLTGLRVVAITTGSDSEPTSKLLRRGPAVIRSRERAVAAADYATAALATPGADIARAHCLPAVDPSAAGATAAGTVGVVVVPRTATRDTPPVPDPLVLQAVARHLAQTAGVVGARVVAVAPIYRVVAVHCLLVGAVGSDLAGLVSITRDRIDDWLDPLNGGDGTGWAFGSPVRWEALVQQLLNTVSQLEAVSQITFGVDGRRLALCEDVELRAGELVWPGTHLLEAAPSARGGAR